MRFKKSRSLSKHSRKHRGRTVAKYGSSRGGIRL